MYAGSVMSSTACRSSCKTEVCAADGGAVTEALVHQIRDIMLDSEDAIDVFDAS